MGQARFFVSCAALCAASVLLIAGASVAAEESRKPGEERIRQALTEPTAFEFIETPMVDVVSYIKEKHGIEIQFDTRALTEAGIATDRPVTKNLKGISLQSALRLWLTDLDLTYVIHNEVMLITTPEEAWSPRHFRRRIYDVRDLATPEVKKVAVPDDGKESREPERKFVTVCDLITSQIMPSSWDEMGGTGTINEFKSDGVFVLVVTHHGEIHDEIDKLLAELRRIRKQPVADK